GLSGHSLLEGSGGFLSGNGGVGDVVQAVVRSTAAHLYEELETLVQSIHHAVDTGEFPAHYLFQLMDVVGKTGLENVQDLVRTEGGSHHKVDGGVVLDLLMPLQGVDGVIGGADKGHIALTDQAPDGGVGVVLELVIAQ